MADLSGDSGLAALLGNEGFAITAELTPPVSGSADDLLALAEPFRGRVDALNVTDGPRALVHMSSLAAAAILSANGIEPILQMTCRDRNRIAMQADLLGASALGIHNILSLRGDDLPADQHPAAKPVFDMDARELIATATRMAQDGICAGDRPIVTRPHFFMGAADTPIDPPPGWRPEGLIAKADAGAGFVQTQLCFDIEIIVRYIGRLVDLGLTERLKILIGTGPLASARSARWMRDNLWGVLVPDSVIERLEQAADPSAEGIAVCSELIEAMRTIPGIAGVHLMAPVKALSILDVLARVRSEGSS
ncbi:MAG: methylenetetrahydrofolate reductase [Proteobacteria bacterium]|nr:methylenetetrahydrofolate reductase [Pseudomonadota bacterium]